MTWVGMVGHELGVGWLVGHGVTWLPRYIAAPLRFALLWYSPQCCHAIMQNCQQAPRRADSHILCHQIQPTE